AGGPRDGRRPRAGAPPDLRTRAPLLGPRRVASARPRDLAALAARPLTGTPREHGARGHAGVQRVRAARTRSSRRLSDPEPVPAVGYRRLGAAGLLASEVGLGTNNSGSRLDEARTRAVIDR